MWSRYNLLKYIFIGLSVIMIGFTGCKQKVEEKPKKISKPQKPVTISTQTQKLITQEIITQKVITQETVAKKIETKKITPIISLNIPKTSKEKPIAGIITISYKISNVSIDQVKSLSLRINTEKRKLKNLEDEIEVNTAEIYKGKEPKKIPIEILLIDINNKQHSVEKDLYIQNYVDISVNEEIISNVYRNEIPISVEASTTPNEKIKYIKIFADEELVKEVKESSFSGKIKIAKYAKNFYGKVNIRIVAENNLGVKNELSFPIVIDTNPPQVNVNFPKEEVLKGVISFSIDLEDETGLATLDIYIDGNKKISLENPQKHLELSLDTMTLFNGTHVMSLVVKDSLQNVRTKEISFKTENFFIETVDDKGNSGLYSSLDIDTNNGYAYIAYYDIENGDLKVARKLLKDLIEMKKGGWNIMVVDSKGDVGAYCSLKVDAIGRVHVAYANLKSDDEDLKYAIYEKGQWKTFTIEDRERTGKYTSIDTDLLNRPHIVFYNYTTGGMQYAYWDGEDWIFQIPDTKSDVGHDNSLKLDSLSQPHISYLDSINGDLKYAFYNKKEGKWSIEVVDTEGKVGFYTSLDLYEDRPYISYYDSTRGCLKLAYKKDGEWVKEVVDASSKSVGKYTSIDIDDNGNIHIAYYDESNGDLKYAYKKRGSDVWIIRTIDSVGDVGRFPSIKVYKNNVIISYYDVTNGNLKVVVFSVLK